MAECWVSFIKEKYDCCDKIIPGVKEKKLNYKKPFTY